MKKRLFAILLILMPATILLAQGYDDEYNQIDESGNVSRRRGNGNDSITSSKVIPKGIKVWTVDPRFGDVIKADVDTVVHMFQNTIFTTGLRGEYNTTGNLGAPRINRIFTLRDEEEHFWFTQPYDYFLTPVGKFHFTNTLSPITNLTYNTAGNRTNGEDHLDAKFGVNIGKKTGIGFNFNYLYGRGYYSNQSTSHFGYTMYGSHLGDKYQAHLLLSTNHQKVTENGGITNDYYITHPETFDDNYQTSEIPTNLSNNWNRNDNQHVFLSHRFNVGFNRKVKMTEEEIEARKFAIESKRENDALKEKEKAAKKARRNGEDFDEESYDKEQRSAGRPKDAKIVTTLPSANDSINTDSTTRIAVNGLSMADSLIAQSNAEAADTAWLKNEYVPVTSFIHTLKFDNYRRIYQAYDSPDDYFPTEAYDIGTFSGDSIYDKTKHYRLNNIFAISMLEGFNKWAKAGLKVYASSDLRHFTLPDTTSTHSASYNEHDFSIGGQLVKRQGKVLHYNASVEACLIGKNSGGLKIDGGIDLNFKFLGDTMRLAADAFMHLNTPGFYFRHYHSKYYWWDNDDLSKVTHTHVGGSLHYEKTKTKLKFAIDRIENYTYLAEAYSLNESGLRTDYNLSVNQHDGSINVLTAALEQDFKLGPLNWQSVITFQKSDNDIISVPTINVYSNLFLRFKIAHVLDCDLGADVRYFTKYAAPDYSPIVGRYVVQDETDKIEYGNYPLINAYANFHLGRTRFFVMMSHLNAGSGNRNYFLVPHYPLNERILRLGVSWNFFN